MTSQNREFHCSRRSMIRSLSAGFMMAPQILNELLGESALGAITPVNPIAPRAPHFAPKAQRVIFIYLSGGFSHVDTFDPKPELNKSQGKEISPNQYLQPTPWEFKRRGKCGMEISNLFPKIGEIADEICLIRSMRTSHNSHAEASLGLHSGSFGAARPSIGSWVSYGLGTLNQNLPSYIVLAPEQPYSGGQLWSSDFLPAIHQGVRVEGGKQPIKNITPAEPDFLQREELDLLASMNRRFSQGARAADSALSARMQSYETAYRMQMEAPDAFDLSKESNATLNLYGVKRDEAKGFGWQCLMARRLAQRGVRFIELIDSGSSTATNWDAAHVDIKSHESRAKRVDQATAALIQDLKGLGLLRDTLVVFTTEFGRTPFVDKPAAKGREHHNLVYSSWLAGAGVKPGITYGESDELGINVAKNEVHLHDFHATILHLLGFDHEKLTFRHAGRDYRLTDVSGNVVKAILA